MSAPALPRYGNRYASDSVWKELDELRTKFRMVISHASGGALCEPGDIDRSTNDICVEISRHKNEIWKHAQEAAKPLRRETGSTRKGDSAARRDRPEPSTHQDRES